MQASLNLGYFPKAFKETTTIVIYTIPKAYRPIGKIFESVIAEIISYLIETYNLLPEEHFRGRPGRSTEDATVLYH